jgi:plastocyanin
MPKQTMGRTLRRIRSLHVPPWTPVLLVIAVVFGILGALFFVRGATGAPRIGDHWHSTYQIFVCGLRQPNVSTFDGPGNNGTHGDGIIHNHPGLPTGEGRGAALDRWFEGGGGKLTKSEMQIPGSRETFKNGDQCPDGTEGTLQVFVNGVLEEDFPRYIPKDGDRIRIVFGAEESAPVQQEDRTVISEDQATRTVELEVTGAEADAAFSPASIDLSAGETVKLAVRNTGTISHGVRVAGPDGQYETSDDYVSDPEIIPPGGEAVLVVRFDDAGEFELHDPTIQQATATIVVGTPEEGEEGAADTGAADDVDVTFEVEMADNVFQPADLEVEAGQTFRINLTNTGELVHNLHIAGADGEYETGDDIESEPPFQRAGGTGSLVAQIDEPGVYEFRCDFHPAEMLGTITVR